MEKETHPWFFHELLGELIKKAGVSSSEICEGLCSVSMMSRILAGERIPGKMLRDRLMERLGVADGRTENYLTYEEYEKWKYRQQIVKCVNEEAYTRALVLLEKYAAYNFENAVEKQFYLNMQIQILVNQKERKKEASRLLESAVLLTVPDVNNRKINSLHLSVKELDLILEYEKNNHADKLVDRCEEIISYVDCVNMDTQSKAKIIPKVMYYQCEAMMQQGYLDYYQMLNKCNQGIECLRDSEKMFYLWELLHKRKQIYSWLISFFENEGDEDKIVQYRSLQKENGRWIELIEDIYMQSGIEPQMKNNAYLYLQQAVYCINDVVKCRRKMMNLSKKKLSEGICDERTVARMENHSSKIQMAIVKKLFDRLNLEGEYQRVDIVTDNPDMLKVLERLVKYSNNFEYEKELHCLEELESSIDMDILINKQFIKRQKASNLFKSNQIGKEEAERRIMEALNYTMSFETIMQKDELFLTDGEVVCIYLMALFERQDQYNNYYKILEKRCKIYEEKGVVSEHIGQYELIMVAVASVLGNCNEFEESDRISRKIMLENIRCRRMTSFHDNLYCMAWNNNERRNQGLPVNDKFEFGQEVEKCLILSKLIKSSRNENFYAKKLEQLSL